MLTGLHILSSNPKNQLEGGQYIGSPFFIQGNL